MRRISYKERGVALRGSVGEGGDSGEARLSLAAMKPMSLYTMIDPLASFMGFYKQRNPAKSALTARQSSQISLN